MEIVFRRLTKKSEVLRGGVWGGITCVFFDVMVALLSCHQDPKLNM